MDDELSTSSVHVYMRAYFSLKLFINNWRYIAGLCTLYVIVFLILGIPRWAALPSFLIPPFLSFLLLLHIRKKSDDWLSADNTIDPSLLDSTGAYRLLCWCWKPGMAIGQCRKILYFLLPVSNWHHWYITDMAESRYNKASLDKVS